MDKTRTIMFLFGLSWRRAKSEGWIERGEGVEKESVLTSHTHHKMTQTNPSLAFIELLRRVVSQTVSTCPSQFSTLKDKLKNIWTRRPNYRWQRNRSLQLFLFQWITNSASIKKKKKFKPVLCLYVAILTHRQQLKGLSDTAQRKETDPFSFFFSIELAILCICKSILKFKSVLYLDVAVLAHRQQAEGLSDTA